MVTRIGFRGTRFAIPLPPLPEQRAIVRYLDHVDDRIRRYVSAKEKLIALLEEERQAVIHRAVTRGLDPNVPLKPSGVEWLGDVPAHWEVRRLNLGSIRMPYEGGDGITAETIDPRATPVYGTDLYTDPIKFLFTIKYIHKRAPQFALIMADRVLVMEESILPVADRWGLARRGCDDPSSGHVIDWFGAILW